MKPLFGKFERVHMVGIGGVGMGGLARHLEALGCRISGSDISMSRVVERLRQEGIEVHLGHRASQVNGADLVVHSAAVPADNEELVAARRQGISMISRAELLAEVTRSHFVVGVAGSHGKTTTASMIASILEMGKQDASTMIGGWIQGQVQARSGSGKLFVVEADEYDRSFLYLHPRAAVVTNIDAEHLDCYSNLAEVQEAFCQYLGRLPFYGTCILGYDDPGVQGILPILEREYFTYGLAGACDFRAEKVELGTWGSCFVLFSGQEEMGPVKLRVPGMHNVRNALGAAALTGSLGVDFAAIAGGLEEFGGIERRFEKKGEIGGIVVVDDYAHHPSELEVSLATARASGRRILAVFQPHLYSRTQYFAEDFAKALMAADQVFLAPVYSAREKAIPGVHSGMIARAMREAGFAAVEYIPDPGRISGRLAGSCRAGDMVITMGAGDIDRVAEELVRALMSKYQPGEHDDP